MSVNYAAEAAKLLRNAARHITEVPNDMRIAEVSALVGNGFASLAHLPEQQAAAMEELAQAQQDLATMRRMVGNFIGCALIDEPSLARPAGILARALRDRGLSVDKQITARMKELGSTYNPDAEVDEEQPVRAPVSTSSLDVEAVLAVVVRQLVRMSTSWENGVRRCAREFTRALDEGGFDIDRRMDELAQETGHGPYLCDMFGLRYDLTKQWADCNGKRWEHTGSWSDVGGPIMRRDEPDGDSMVLADLIRNRGPLYTVVPAPRSTVVREQELPPF